MPKEKLEFVALIVATTLFVLLLIAAGILLFRIYLKRKNRLLLEQERMSIQYEQTLLRSKLEIQEQTFTYISREIHDNIGQVLSLVRINLNTVECPSDPKKMVLMDDLIGKAITDLRNLSHSLDSDMIRNSGWTKAAERLFADLQKAGTFNVDFHVDENLPAIGHERPIILFRMIQELLNNIIKHAGASIIKFHATRQDDKIVVKLEDDGKGFDQSSAGSGAGLQNLASRAKIIDADLKFESEPSKGTRVTIYINTGTNA